MSRSLGSRKSEPTRRLSATKRRRDLPLALLSSAVATAVAMVLQNVVRDTWQVRTLPERVMEWLLVFVPLDLFERGLRQLGPDAKEVALGGTTGGMAVVLLVVGALAVRAGWSGWRLLGLGGALWLVAMAVVMPLTGAGFFAVGLLVSPLLTAAGFLVVFLGYASVLLAGAGLAQRTSPFARSVGPERRALLAGLAGTAAAYGVARLVGRAGGAATSSLPLAAAPTQPVATPAPLPTATAKPLAQSSVAPPSTPAPTAAPLPTVTPDAFPTPQAVRRVDRDQAGSLATAGRPKGSLAPAITDIGNFYVVTKNAVADPVLDANSWRLVIEGEVVNPVQIDYRTLRLLPPVQVTKTLECISNFTDGCEMASYGCDLISTARWTGARLNDVLDLAGGLKPSVVSLAFLATDEFSAGLPAEAASDPDTLVVYAMNDQVLLREHGYPARLLVPGRYGMKNPKWLASIRALDQQYVDWYEQRSWNRDGVVKTMGRIDVPVNGATLAAGQQRIAGIAYAGNRGVANVEFSADGGQTWQMAGFLEPAPGKDTMVRWEGTFTVAPGTTVNLVERVTDGTGAVQPDDFSLPQPDGASGRHSIDVHAG